MPSTGVVPRRARRLLLDTPCELKAYVTVVVYYGDLWSAALEMLAKMFVALETWRFVPLGFCPAPGGDLPHTLFESHELVGSQLAKFFVQTVGPKNLDLSLSE
jgi:hypothetical protein